MRSSPNAGDTPRHRAVLHDRMNNADLLLRAGAEAGARSEADKTPLDVATEAKRPAVIYLLRRRGLPQEGDLLRISKNCPPRLPAQPLQITSK